MLTIIYSYTELSKQAQFVSVSMKPEIGLLLRMERPDNAPVFKHFITETTPILSYQVCENWLCALQSLGLELNKIHVGVQGYGNTPTTKVIQKKDQLLDLFETIRNKMLVTEKTQNRDGLDQHTPEIDTTIRGKGSLTKLDLIDYLLHEKFEAMDNTYIHTVLQNCTPNNNSGNLYRNFATNLYPMHRSSITSVSGLTILPTRSPMFSSLTPRQLQQLKTLDAGIKKLNYTFNAPSQNKKLANIISELHKIDHTYRKGLQQTIQDSIKPHIAKYPSLLNIISQIIKTTIAPMNHISSKTMTANETLILGLLYTNTMLYARNTTIKQTVPTVSKIHKPLIIEYIHLAAQVQCATDSSGLAQREKIIREHYHNLDGETQNRLKISATFVGRILSLSVTALSSKYPASIFDVTHFEKSGLEAIRTLRALLDVNFLYDHSLLYHSRINTLNNRLTRQLNTVTLPSIVQIDPYKLFSNPQLLLSQLLSLAAYGHTTHTQLKLIKKMSHNKHAVDKQSLLLYLHQHPNEVSMFATLLHVWQSSLLEEYAKRSPQDSILSISEARAPSPVTINENTHKPLSVYLSSEFLLKCVCAGLLTCALIVLILTVTPVIAVNLGSLLSVSVPTLQYAAYAGITVGGMGLFAPSIREICSPKEGDNSFASSCC